MPFWHKEYAQTPTSEHGRVKYQENVSNVLVKPSQDAVNDKAC
jgi:hypothetical protein